MSVTLLVASTLHLKLNGGTEDYACQVLAAALPGSAESAGTKLYTGCPAGVVTVPDPESATDVLRLSWLQDWGTGGLSRVLAGLAGQTVPFELVLDPDDAAHKRTYAGTLTVPRRLPDEWEARKEQRAQVDFTCPTLTGPTFA